MNYYNESYLTTQDYAGHCAFSGDAMTLESNNNNSIVWFQIVNGGSNNTINLVIGCESCKTKLDYFVCSIALEGLDEPQTIEERNAMIREMRMYIQSKYLVF